MKSNQSELANRGFLEVGVEKNSLNLTISEKLILLKSNVAMERTLGARLLAYNDETIYDLIQALKVEKKLYPKIEICNTLVVLGKTAVKPLIAELGRIGNNQHKDLSNKAFEKDSYPLPRDIAARTLAHIGEKALPDLLNVLKESDSIRLSEAIDAIGYICFYSYSPSVFEKLKECYIRNASNDLVCWKIFRAMSGCPSGLQFLVEQRALCKKSILLNEIDRSIRLIEKRELSIR
ncbi:MAG: hypothetical protein AB7S48_00305 [Bacteroidales bacterium]